MEWKYLINRWHSLKLFDKNLIVYWFFLTVLIGVFHNNVPHWGLYLVAHLVLSVAIVFLMPYLDGFRHPVVHFFRYWYVVMSFPFLYMEVGPLIHMITPREFDPWILGVDKALFGVLPNLWVQQWVSPLLTEVMQISYSIYWLTIPLGGFIFYLSRKYYLFEKLVHYVTLTFFLSYFIFILFPVAGPRFYLAEQIHASYHTYTLGNWLRQFMSGVGFRGGAFPSSHVGVATVIFLFVRKFRPRIAYLVILPMLICLSLATVYGQYHYFTDVLAGLSMGLIIGIRGSRATDRRVNHLIAREKKETFVHTI